jgi:hypothetical protein
LEKHLHIICLNVPYPVDYGGVFDLFYKLPALQEVGVKIHLHCFEYGRGQQPELEKYCESVHYYKRQTGLSAFSFKLPYIVSSRRSNELFQNLLKDDYPILMEGVHCTYLLTDARFSKRTCYVRLHNVEHVYYKNLFRNASSLVKKMYYFWESRLLYQYEKTIASKANFWTVIPTDAPVYKKLGAKTISYLPLFLPGWTVQSEEGKGSYCLYHGDLSVAENEKAAKWLLNEVFNGLDFPLVIAGKNPSPTLQQLAEQATNTCLVANPGNSEMQDMIRKAHVHVLPSYNATGIKLKLLNALFIGRFCVVNNATVYGTQLEETCHVANTAAETKNQVADLFNRDFSQREITKRKQLLEHMFDNKANAIQVVKQVWRQE